MNLDPCKDIFELVWNLFEETDKEDFQKTLKDLDFEAIGNLLKITAELIENESHNSIKFALLLSFKKGILDFAISAFPLLKMKPFLVVFYLIYRNSCILWNVFVYCCLTLDMILNTLPTDDDEENWLADDLEKAYSIFEYLVKWINWKIVENGDLEYYETYFQDYNSIERYGGYNGRKRVMSSIGGDMLAFIARKAKTKSICLVMDSLTEIIPLLNVDHFVVFWLFYQKIEGPISPLMDSTTSEQRYFFLLNYEYPTVVTPVTPGRLSFSGSPNTIKMDLEENWKLVSEAFCVELGRRFKISAQEGDQFLPKSCSISDDLYEVTWKFHKYAINELSVIVRVLHFTPTAFSNIMKLPKIENIVVIQTCLFQWAQGTKEIKSKGRQVLNQIPKEMLDDAVSNFEIVSHLELVKGYLNIPF